MVLLEGDGAAGEAAFAEVLDRLKADSFARLAAFDGRSSLGAFLALFARRTLIEALPAAFAAEPERAWRRFERMFGRDIQRRVARRFPRADRATQEDFVQEVHLALIEGGFRRLRGFHGKGSFEGFVLVMVDRMLVDLLRKEATRQRLPAEVGRRPPLEQAVFAQVAWRGRPPEAARLLEALGRRFPGADLADVASALAAVRPAIEEECARRAFGRISSIDDAGEDGRPFEARDDLADPEEALVRRQEAEAEQALITAITQAARSWPDDERCYLQTFLSSGGPPRVIAQLMGRPVEDIRQIQQRVMRKLGQIAAVRKTSGASVFSGRGMGA